MPAGWRIDHLGTTTYQSNMNPEAFAMMCAHAGDAQFAERMRPVLDRLTTIEPLLDNHVVVHMPVWALVASRTDY